MAALSSPSSLEMAPAKKKWRRGNKKVIDRYIEEARAALAAAQDTGEDGDDAAAAALGLATAALELAPRADAAQELQARALLALRRYRDVADLLRDHIPSCSPRGDDASSSSSSSCSATERELLSPGPGRERDRSPSVAARFLCCFDVSELKRRLAAGFSKPAEGAQCWRYLVLGQACFHLGLMEDAVVLLQTGRRLATAAFRRESVCWSEDSFSPSSSNVVVSAPPAGKGVAAPTGEAESVSQLLAHVKLLLRRRAAAVAALDAGFPAEAVRHFNKVLDARRGGVLPHPFATACLVGRAAAFRGSGRPADAVADCNKALALDPAFIPALRARADLLESVGALPDCLRDLDHLKLLYDAALRDGKLPGPTWRSQGGVRFAEIAAAHRALTARIQQLRGRVAAGGEGVDYYALLGVRRGCTRMELERAHLLLKLKPDRSTSFAERLELVDEHRDLEAVRDQARMSAMFLYRMLQKGCSFIMSAVLDQEAAERQRAKDAAAAQLAAAAALIKQQEQDTAVPPVPAEKSAPVVPVANGGGDAVRHVTTKPLVEAAIPAPMSSAATPFQGVFCRDMAVVGNLLSRGGFDRPVPIKCEAMSC